MKARQRYRLNCRLIARSIKAMSVGPSRYWTEIRNRPKVFWRLTSYVLSHLCKVIASKVNNRESDHETPGHISNVPEQTELLSCETGTDSMEKMLRAENNRTINKKLTRACSHFSPYPETTLYKKVMDKYRKNGCPCLSFISISP